ncbi:hypothetical protein [Limimaricola cinnabarinus]|uniref:hypothetical protein n=1 Tax=Limimaricola cinnabarinus TaxID=1125964 RepID=UPI0005ECC6B5|nr:hypothetical protein [Limimaricola cinnabarinus]
MSKPTEYLMPKELVALVEKAKPSLHLLRLFHGCYAFVDSQKHLSVGVIATTGLRGCSVACSDIAAIAGSPGGKSNAWVEAAIDAGDWRHLFSHLSLDTTGRDLTFKFAPKVGNAWLRQKADPFAMLDSEEVRKISSANEVLFYTQAAMVHRAEQPMFNLPFICPISQPWNDDTKKTWLRIAVRVGQKLGQDYVFIPKRDPLNRLVVAVVVKVVTSSSLWSPGALFPRPPCPPVSVVHDSGFSSLRKAELIARRNWTRATGS